jgi:hypothetical protein
MMPNPSKNVSITAKYGLLSDVLKPSRDRWRGKPLHPS